MATPEGLIERQILMWLKAKRIMAWKVKSTATYDPVRKVYRKPNALYRVGVADILGIYKGRPLAIEVKSARGRLSEEQARFLTEFAAHGGIAIVARSVDHVEMALRQNP